MKKALLTTMLLFAAIMAAGQTLVTPTCRNHGLKGKVHIVQYAWLYDTGDGYAIGNTKTQVYDTAGRLVYELEMSPDGLDDDLYYTYDSLGRLATETTTKHEPFTDTYHYGPDGRLLTIERRHSSEPFTEFDNTMTVQRYDTKGRPTELKTYGQPRLYSYWPNGEIRHVSEPDIKYNAYYNEQGLLDSINAISSRHYYHYNESGDLISEDTHTSTAHFHTEYTYDFFDSHGNWTDRTMDSNDGTNSFDRRTIIYYEP